MYAFLFSGRYFSSVDLLEKHKSDCPKCAVSNGGGNVFKPKTNIKAKVKKEPKSNYNNGLKRKPVSKTQRDIGRSLPLFVSFSLCLTTCNASDVTIVTGGTT